MKQGKKIWFTGFSRTLWVPVSIEGWGVTLASIFALYLIFKFNNVSDDIPFVFSQHWPVLVELAILVLAMYSVSSGHVDKRY